ncbi:hypothetical protein [Methylobrevis pamukkalensis]|uniref:Uncharacterized protein n=1 Tax=Methylobrevis pamukkalensis TaxID=1439726 RepID=A0A1E3H4K4_9HYPH|nr:hypothetical protein [Methylobrevis pamukkalensis]ODN71244.1 hypothetical protein A6302_01441 [Methylobrevis pamukkalensis]
MTDAAPETPAPATHAVGDFLILGPDEGENHWQPVPANGHISVRVAPKLVNMEHPVGLGTQTVRPAATSANMPMTATRR